MCPISAGSISLDSTFNTMYGLNFSQKYVLVEGTVVRNLHTKTYYFGMYKYITLRSIHFDGKVWFARVY
jgi:hypothetical protein